MFDRLFGGGEKGDPVAAARQAARKVIDNKKASKVSAFLTSEDPLVALATALEFNFNWHCCERVDIFTGVPSIPGRLATLGNEYFCTHCDFYSLPFSTDQIAMWLDDPQHSPAGAKRHPPTDEDGANWGFEAVQRMIDGLDALQIDDPDQYLALCERKDPLSLRILERKLDRVLELIPAQVVARRLRNALAGSEPSSIYDRINDAVAEKLDAHVEAEFSDASEESRSAILSADERIEKARTAGHDRLNLTGEEFSAMSELPRSITGLAGLQRLMLEASSLSDLQLLERLSDLKSLELRGAGTSALSTLARLRSLEDLKLESCSIVSLADIAGFSNLKSLTINDAAVSDLSPLGGLTSLGTLKLNRTEVSDISPIAALPNLAWLEISEAPIADLSALENNRSLTRLSLSGTQVSDLGPLQNLGQLTNLKVADCPVADIGPIAALSQLRELYLERTSVADIEALSSGSLLRHLGLDGCPVADMSPLSALTALEGVSLIDTPVADIHPLSNHRGLCVLWLDGTQVSDLGPLEGMDKLIQLKLNGTLVRDLSPISGLTKLGTLHLNDTTELADLSPVVGLPLDKGVYSDDCGLHFRGSRAAELDPSGLGEIAKIEDSGRRSEQALAYLRKRASAGAETDNLDSSSIGLSAEDLPEVLFVPASQHDLSAVGLGVGTVDISLLDPDGNLAITVWRNSDDAKNWLQNGGATLWHKNDRPPKSNQILVLQKSRDDLVNRTIGGQFDAFLHLEPDVGRLFSPPDRRLRIT